MNTEINPSANEGASPPTEGASPPTEGASPPTDSENSNELTLEMAQQIAKIYMSNKQPIPQIYNEIINPKDINKKIFNLLQHEFWRDNTIPTYQNDPDCQELSLDPDKPESFVNYFWLDKDLKEIVRQSNKYIDKKNKLKNKYHPNKRRQLRKKATPHVAHTNLTELKRFMSVVMYMATYGLPSLRNYWREQHETVPQPFTLNRFEQLRSSIHF